MPLGPAPPFGGAIGGAFTGGAWFIGMLRAGGPWLPTGRAANLGGADLIGGGPLPGWLGFPKPGGGGLFDGGPP